MAVKMSDRKFGVEIEFCTNEDIEWWEEKLRSKTGINVVAYGSFHDGWILEDDGSVDGWELVSPILSGVEGIAEVAKMIAAIKALGGWMEGSCGFHVHVDANDFSPTNIISAVKKYERNEMRLDRYVNPSRRYNNNEYCHSTTRLLRELQEEIECSSLEYINWDYVNRYYKLNVAAFAKHGTLEFRHHEGSLDITKITNWIKFCVRFMEDVKQGGRFKGPVQTTYQNSRSYPVIAKLLLDGAGKTTKKEIATSLNVSENTVSKYISLFRRKFDLDIKAEGNLYSVHGVPPASMRRQLLVIAA